MDIGRVGAMGCHLVSDREPARTVLKLVEHYSNTCTSSTPGSIVALRALDYAEVGERLQALLDARL